MKFDKQYNSEKNYIAAKKKKEQIKGAEALVNNFNNLINCGVLSLSRKKGADFLQIVILKRKQLSDPTPTPNAKSRSDSAEHLKRLEIERKTSFYEKY